MNSDKTTNLLNTQKSLAEENSLKYLIELGTKGHYPLFFNDWVNEYYTNNRTSQPPKYSTLKKAKQQISERYNELSKHRNLDRQRMALQALGDGKREEFISSFMVVVESKIMDKIEVLQ